LLLVGTTEQEYWPTMVAKIAMDSWEREREREREITGFLSTET
jgi:hypothetical protein